MKLLFIYVIFFSCSSHYSKEELAPLRLRILHTNDHHGHYLPDRHGQYGMAPRKTLIDRLRKEISSVGGSSLLLSGGDINTGTMESDIFNAKPDFLGMKEIGYDAMAVGNHEFDNSYETLKQQKKWAAFPFLSANIFWKGTNKRVFDPLYIIKEIQGVKVAIFGLTTIDAPLKASHDDAKNLFDFRSIIDSSKEVVALLKKKEEVDLIIAVTHVGHRGSLTSNGDMDLAKKVDGIDIIIGGHSQEIINAQKINSTLIVQALDWGKYVGVLDLLIDKNKQKGLDFKYKLIPVNLKKKVDGKRVFISSEIKSDNALVELFKPYKEDADKIGLKVVGQLSKTLLADRVNVRSQQMPIAQFMGDALMRQVKGIDAVVLNGGSMRSPLNAGKVTRRDLHNVHPYGNGIITVVLSKDDFFNYIESVTQHLQLNEADLSGAYPHFVNMKLTFKKKKLIRIEDRDQKWTIEKNAGKINSHRKSKFTLGTLNFLAKGGDGYPVLTKNPSYTDSGFMINSAMMNFFEKEATLDGLKYEAQVKDILKKEK